MSERSVVYRTSKAQQYMCLGQLQLVTGCLFHKNFTEKDEEGEEEDGGEEEQEGEETAIKADLILLPFWKKSYRLSWHIQVNEHKMKPVHICRPVSISNLNQTEAVQGCY